MSLTFTDARDEILTLFVAAWDAQPSPPPILYPDTITLDQLPNGNRVEVTVQHTLGFNSVIGGGCFTRQGFVTAAVFTTFGDSLSSADAFAKVAADAFQGKSTPGGVWFRNTRYNEVGRDAQWFRTNVISDFTYEERI